MSVLIIWSQRLKYTNCKAHLQIDTTSNKTQPVLQGNWSCMIGSTVLNNEVAQLWLSSACWITNHSLLGMHTTSQDTV